MNAKFSLDDDSVVVIVGSGAGGGTLADELTRRGVNVVILEAGKHYTQADCEERALLRLVRRHPCRRGFRAAAAR